MPRIELTTVIDGPIDRCFDLARSIDLHRFSTGETKEEAIAGKISGLIGDQEFVTWKATHLGFVQTLTSKISAYRYPSHFRDEMIDGIFKMIRHDHFFKEDSSGRTIMHDVFEFESPGGFLGRLFNFIFLTRYLRKLLLARNAIIKQTAETDHWKVFLKS
jgi:ligand-binding SRPBCC domain-containing protein